MQEKDKEAIDAFLAQGGNSSGALVRHYLYFDRRPDAKRIAKLLNAKGFKSEAERSATGEKWLVLVTHHTPVSDASMENLRDFFERLVEKERGGEYDGWEAGIES
jgi:Regulator of ribonuclease activity B